MKNFIQIANSQLLENSGMSTENIESLMSSMLKKNIDQADLYFQNIYREFWLLEDNKVRDGSFSIDKGVGVRAIAREKTGFAFSDEILMPSLQEAVNTVNSIATANKEGIVPIRWKKNDTHLIYQPDNPITEIDSIQKIEILNKINEYARTNQYITRVDASLSGSFEIVLIINNEGQWHADLRPLVRRSEERL